MTYVSQGAVISTCGNYRYHLWREWRGTGTNANWDWLEDDDGSIAKDGAGAPLGEPKSVLFVMLNPSTADGDQDDPTIRRCVAFAKAWGYDRMEVVNLFAWRATDPSAVLRMTGSGPDPVGPDNQRHVRNALDRAGVIVCAWGAHGGHIDQDETMLGWIEQYGGEPYALRLTKEGFPAHPLYLPRDLRPAPYAGRVPA
ncbi:DUF1643 domain-containing protein [Sphingomonas montanisoli]|uniref:DUF1643 domain-containing protein n=1 Tax=Sphingomonas montanisoli TaxID=2606412 RepID=A0A5D9C4Q3_9SPHN|nr:DUF1643 domain-containing protein [Sphingomonas montanisoli]TZG26476.1 DUF1643 domain-containing protein [Sphingomonas montanisoli]